MAVAPVHPECVAMGYAGRLVIRVFPADPERVIRIKVFDSVILHVNAWYAVICGWQKETMIESNFQGAGLEFPVPVRFFSLPKAKMPLAYNSC